ncbi:MAG TPA: inorganic phosphate transporter [Jiangellaceae bacterium]
MGSEALIALAIAFAVVTGANDGGALVSTGLRVPALSVPVSVTILVAAVVAGPLVLGTAVAETLTGRLVPEGPDSATLLAIGFVIAVVVVWMLARAGLPTSLTLAVIGGISGAGLGMGSTVEWSAVVRVLAIGMVAPFVGAVLAMLATRAWHVAPDAPYLPTVRRAHVAAFALQCAAYGTNDGQKVLVLFLAATAAGGGNGDDLAWWTYPVVALAFAVGTAIGLPKLAASLGTGIMSTRPTHAVTAEFAAAAAVLGSTAIATPVSMTQSIAGALVGVGVHDGYRRLRWHTVRMMAGAWAVTLPASLGLAALVGLIVSSLPS